MAGHGLPACEEEKGVKPALGSRPCVDEKARGVLGSGVVPGGRRLGTLSEAEDVAGSGGRGHGRLQNGIGEMRSARASIAPTRLSEATRLPRTVRPPFLLATRGASGRGWRVVPHECRREGSHRALPRVDPLVVRAAPSAGEPGEQAQFILKCFDDRTGATCARIGTGRLPVSLRGRQAA